MLITENNDTTHIPARVYCNPSRVSSIVILLIKNCVMRHRLIIKLYGLLLVL